MKRKILARSIFLCIVLGSALSMGEAAMINGGTSDVSDVITANDDYVIADSNVVLNATGNTSIFEEKSGGVLLRPNASGVNITINGNEHDLHFENNNSSTIISAGSSISNSTVAIKGAKNITFKKNQSASTTGSSFAISTTNGTYSFEASNDINIINSPYDFHGDFITISGKNDVSFTAGRDINLSGTDNILQIEEDYTGTMKFRAEHDIVMTGTEYGRPPINLTAGNFIMSAGNDLVLTSPSNPMNVGRSNKETTALFQAENNIKIVSSGESGGVALMGSKGNVTMLANKGKLEILSTGGNTATIMVQGGTIAVLKAGKEVNIGGNADRAVRVRSGSSLDIAAGEGYAINIEATDVSGEINAGIYTDTTSQLKLHSNTVITAVDKSIHAAGGTITMDKGLTATAATRAIQASDGAKVTATNAESAKKLAGTITADGSGTGVDVVLGTADSYFTGSTDVTNSGAVNLAFAKGGIWNVTADSNLTDLANNSTVNMRYTVNSTNETVTAANLRGSGTYVMNTDLQASKDSSNVTQNGDKLVITTSSAGSNLLDLRDISLDKKLASEGYLLLVEDQSKGSATFTGKDLAHGGIFKYKPVITTDNPTDYTGYNANATNWYLTGFERTIDVSDNTNVTKALGDTRYANYLADNDTLLKRLGELRMLKDQPQDDGFWARYRHGSSKTDMVDGKFTTFQLGYDKRTSSPAAKDGDGVRYTGIAFSHTDNKYDSLGVGHGDGSQDALSVYNTWLGDKEHYFDIVAKVGKMRGNSTYEDSLFPETGDYGVWFYSLSGEYGRKNKVNSGWYYEPQVQLTLGRINGDDYTTSRDTKVSQDSINSVILRTGVTVGKEFNMDKPEKRSNVYAKINWNHDFRGDSGLNMTDTYGDSASFTNELGGTYWNAGVGATLNLNKRTHLYVGLEKNFGGHVTSNWIGQAGCRWTW